MARKLGSLPIAECADGGTAAIQLNQSYPWVLSAAGTPHQELQRSVSPLVSCPRISRHPKPRPAAAMEHLKTRFILSIPFVVLGFLLTNAPFMMTSVTPSRPWADGPMGLVTTPQFLTKKVLHCPTCRFPAWMSRLGC